MASLKLGINNTLHCLPGKNYEFHFDEKKQQIRNVFREINFTFAHDRSGIGHTIGTDFQD